MFTAVAFSQGLVKLKQVRVPHALTAIASFLLAFNPTPRYSWWMLGRGKCFARIVNQCPHLCSRLCSPAAIRQRAGPDTWHLEGEGMHSLPLCTAMEEHEAEIAAAARFGAWPSSTSQKFSDADFDTIGGCMASHYAGPEGAMLPNACSVYATVSPVLDRSECDMLRAEASAAMVDGKTSAFTYTESARIGEVHVADLPKGAEWLRKKLHTTFFPLIASRFGLDASQLAVYDALIIQYDASRNATRQPMHRDASLVSLNVALSDASEYTGGGTRFEALGDVVHLSQGHCACHASGLRHAGNSITSGVRWVLVVFVLAKTHPQLASRCAGAAVVAKARAKDASLEERHEDVEVALSEAEAALAAALHLSPRDHECHHALGGLHAMRGDLVAARTSLLQAMLLYPPCPKPRNALGTLLMGLGRPRAAFRYFEAAFERAASSYEDSAAVGSLIYLDEDLRQAAINGALCVVWMLEEYGASPTSLATALNWIRGVIDSSDNVEPRMQALLLRAEALK